MQSNTLSLQNSGLTVDWISSLFLGRFFTFDFYFIFLVEIKPEEIWSFPASHGRIFFSLRWNNGLRSEEHIWHGNSAHTHPGESQAWAGRVLGAVQDKG